ncbi:hypothetical protein SAMN05421788_101831 [Filimonas lacunae]|uniref:Uncharacterized protein n=1 Tax=Filimonas lacunae TaxID=477680 RepID=A0A173MP01_9BACT|nr:hypothetical protein [Filimonas lacunae]BAV09395.1 hypothetical protein FLA_5443 [Filimonas lacunae]SIS72366.1 hypothetical protein SAMN05421788_101831 [Filimonas lacunae]
MIRTDNYKGASLKDIKERERKEKDSSLREQCSQIANERYGEDTVKKWSNTYKGLFFLPVLNEEEKIDKLAVLKPIDRHILSFASTKISDEGLYLFLEACMRECWIDGDKEILDDDEYFIPAANSLNKLIEGKKAILLKR